MKRLLPMTGAVAMLALESAAARMPASSFDSDPVALDTRIGTVGLSVDQMLDSRTGSQDVSAPGKLNTTKAGVYLFIR